MQKEKGLTNCVYFVATKFYGKLLLEGNNSVWVLLGSQLTKEVIGRLRRIIENSSVVPACRYTNACMVVNV